MEVRKTTSPAVQHRRLRTELRRARLDLGLTQEQVAEAMDWSLSKLIRIENGSVGISTNDLKAILAHYKITDEGRNVELLGLARGARERSCWSTYREASPRLIQLVEYEFAASIIRNFQPMPILGLLQTEEYAGLSSRQLELPLPEAPPLFFMLDESAKPAVTIEVAPFTAGLVPGLQTAFVIHEFLDDADNDSLIQYVRSSLEIAHRSGRVIMFTIIIISAVVLIALSIIYFTAYMIDAESFEFSTAIWKVVSFSIKMRSARKRRRADS